jgi:hypothetical protein
MATEKIEPQTGLIMQVGVVAVVTLLVVHAALTSYFDHIASAEEQRKIGNAKPVALMNLRADEQQRLTSGAMPIDKAKEQLVAQGRMNASPAIVPSASRDVAPLQGWSKMPSEPPAAMMAPPPEPAPAVAGDAGAGAAPDAGPSPRGPKPAGGAAPKAPQPPQAPKHP